MATETAEVPFVIEQDEDGVWCGRAMLPYGVAVGDGDTREAAIADLREALLGLVAEFGFPETLALELEVA